MTDTNKELKIFEVMAKSNEDQKYMCKLTCEEDKIEQALEEHMIKKHWEEYDYKLVSYTLFRENND